MAIRITCPGCKKPLTLDDDKRGQKVRCDHCDKALSIPAASGAKRESATAVRNGQTTVKVKAKPAPMPPPEFDEVEEAPKKKKKKKQSGPGLMIGIIAGGAVVFLVALIWVGLHFLSGAKFPEPEPERPMPMAKNDVKEPVRVVPKIQDGNPANTKKGGIAIVNSVRGAGYRLERQSELKQIGLSFQQYFDEYKGASRNMDTWLEYIKTYGPIKDAVKDGYYKMNFDARAESSSVVAYERDMDNGQKHLCAFFGGRVDYVPLAELKTILGRDP